MMQKCGICRKMSEESVRKMAESKRGKPSRNKGLTLSVEHRKKLSKAKKGIVFSEEHRKSLSEAQRHVWMQRRNENKLTEKEGVIVAQQVVG